ncbi:hypothetical protein ACSMFT_16520 [Ectopseudomonas oleovorans]|uniref:hypothetical protein n=1 Tax=Ectopseudomonas oleovorans TaxID=301 RepID=UPI0029494683|nr:hypothetical protein [Pseudomonas mendocina]MDV5859667.1 hypothetical protein [Pseudomonas mendocina]
MPENKPKLIVFAGPNGSGKTSITETLREHHWLSGCTFINPSSTPMKWLRRSLAAGTRRKLSGKQPKRLSNCANSAY